MINIDGFLTGCSKYPLELLSGRIAIEGNVISCIAKDLLLLDEADIDTKDFISEDACYYFGLFKNIRARGFSSLDEITILSNISEFIEIGFQERGGWNAIQNLIDIINIKNWDTYLDILCRENIIINLYNDGFNLLSPIEENGKQIIPLELFRKMDSESVMDWYESRLSGFGTGYSNKVLEEEEVGIDDEFLERLEDGLENGVPFDIFGEDIEGKEVKCLPFLSRQLNGLMDGTTTVLGGYSSAGKALTMDSLILSKDGYKEMRNVSIGDNIYGEDGKLHVVLGVYPQGVKDIYEVKFNDGSISKCSKDHLWNIQTQNDRRLKKPFRTLTLEQIMSRKLYHNTKSGVKWDIFIPMTKPVEFQKNKLPIDPYVLGLLIGDDSLGCNSFTFSNPEEDIIKMLREKLGDEFLVKYVGSGCDYRIFDKLKYKFKNVNDEGYKNRLKIKLDNLDLLNKKSADKFIPNIYKYSSIQDRIDLLAGLIDTDGEIDKSAYIYSSVSKILVEDIKFIAETLGGTCSISERQTYFNDANGDKKKGQKSYRLYMRVPNDIHIFKSIKHKKKYKLGRVDVRRNIREIKYIGKEECQCIMVDNPSGLFLTNNCIVTHNTTAWITVIMGLIYRDRKILIISNEQKAKVFKIQFVVWLLAKRFKYFNLTKKKLMSGDISEQDKAYLKKAQEYWNTEIKGKVKFIAIPDADMTLVKKKIRENVLKHGYDTVLYDTLKLDLNTDNKQYYLELIKDSREFDKMSKKYNIIMLLSLQLAINTLGKLFLDASVLSMSKQIKEVLENLLLMRTVYPEELDPENKKYYCKPFQRKNIAGKWCEEEYIPDQTAVWRMLFVDKARSGENSSDNGIAYLLRFDGAHGTFLEASMCRPKHVTIT